MYSAKNNKETLSHKICPPDTSSFMIIVKLPPWPVGGGVNATNKQTKVMKNLMTTLGKVYYIYEYTCYMVWAHSHNMRPHVE